VPPPKGFTVVTGAPDENGSLAGQGQSPAQEVDSPWEMAKTTGKALMKFGANAAQGVGESVLNTVGGLGDIAHAALPKAVLKTPYGRDLEAGAGYLHELGTPETGVQGLFKGAGDVGQFLIPAEAEEAGAAKLAKLVPWLGRGSEPTAHALTTAASTGLVNKAEGGSFAGGAAPALAIGAAMPVLQKMVPTLIRSAGSFVDPELMSAEEAKPAAESIRRNTTGIRPITIARQAAEKEKEWANARAAIDKLTGQPFNMGAPRVFLNQAQGEAERNMDPVTQRLIKRLREPLEFETSEGQPVMRRTGGKLKGGAPAMAPARIPPLIDVERARGAEQAIGNQINAWPPEVKKLTAANQLKMGLYQAFKNELAKAAPGAVPYTEQIANIIPGKNAFYRAAQWPGMGESILNRVARPTGALTGALGGGYLGYQHGGPGGAAVGALTGLILPELVSSRSGKMAVARALDSPRTWRAARAVAAPATRRLTGTGYSPWAAGQ
jgi:hypothetical protein